MSTVSILSYPLITFAGPISQTAFEHVVKDVRKVYFQELSDVEIIVTRFDEEDNFLQAQPKKETITRNPRKRIYEIQVNSKILHNPPPLEALRAILAHELEHIVDYTQMSFLSLLKLGVQYSTSLEFKVMYERTTDRKVLAKGLGEGLAKYREWLYKRLNPRELQLKRMIYLTPEEIRGY